RHRSGPGAAGAILRRGARSARRDQPGRGHGHRARDPARSLVPLVDDPGRRDPPGGAMKRLLLLSFVVACSAKTPAGETPRPTAEPRAAETGPPSPSRVVTERFHTDALGVDKAVVIYLPRGYDSQASRRWPVFYYLHGLGGNETNWTKDGHLDGAADELGLAAIVVMPDGDDGFYIDSAFKIDYDQCIKDGTGLFVPSEQPHDTTCVRARNYETYIAKDLVSWVDAHYRTLSRREGRGIAGLSMGGFGAMELGLRHQDLFAAAASHSGAIALLY